MHRTFFLFLKRFSSAANKPDWSDPAIGWERTIFETPSILIWFFTLEVSVIVVSVFQTSWRLFKTSNVCLGGIARIIKSMSFVYSLQFISSMELASSSIICFWNAFLTELESMS